MKMLLYVLLAALCTTTVLTAQTNIKSRSLTDDDVELMQIALQPNCNPGVASVMSLVAPYLGAYYNDQIALGTLLIVADVAGIIAMSSSRSGNDAAVVGLGVIRLVMAFVAPYSASSSNASKREAIIELHRRGINLSETSIFPTYSPNAGIGIGFSMPIH
ncbi:MAG: hypothetical protein ACKO9V_05945 [Candidatus Kapaibacterium sp.]